MSSNDDRPVVINVDEAEEIERLIGERWGGRYRILTPSMRPRGGSLGVNFMRVPPGRAAVPFHTHRREDEVFYVLTGRGVLRYGDEVRQLRPGDCVSCPAGSGVAHQIANPSEDEELTYLAIGPHDPDEVCTYPDNGKVMVRGLQKIGWIEAGDYMAGEPDPPRWVELADDAPDQDLRDTDPEPR